MRNTRHGARLSTFNVADFSRFRDLRAVLALAIRPHCPASVLSLNCLTTFCRRRRSMEWALRTAALDGPINGEGFTISRRSAI
jgi:hypothetical protein